MALTMNLTNVQREEPTFKTATGEIVTLTDAKGEQYFREMKAEIIPVQDLNGYDHPWPAGGGKNLLRPVVKNVVSAYGLTLTPNDDGSVRITGTPTNGTAVLLSRQILSQDDWILPAGTYVISRGSLSANDNVYLQVVPYSGSTMYSRNAAGTYTYAEDKSIHYLDIGINSNDGSAIDFTIYPQIESGSTATTFSPYSNICPISGWSEAKVTRTGKNFFQVPSIELGGTNPRTVNINVDPIPTGQYYFSSVRSGTVTSNYCIQFIGNNGLVAQVSTNAQRINITEPIIRIYAYMSSADYSDGKTLSLSDIQLERGSSVSTYEPYQGEEVTIQLGQTVYGGTLDVRRGKVRVTHQILDFSAVTWTAQTRSRWLYNGLQSTIKKPASTAVVTTAISDTFPSVSNDNIYSDETLIALAINNNGSVVVRNGSTIDQPTGHMVYELAAPFEVSVTPETIKALVGENNVWADTGEVTVTYKVDPNAEPTLTLASPLGANLGSFSQSDIADEEVITEAEDTAERSE